MVFVSYGFVLVQVQVQVENQQKRMTPPILSKITAQ
jgi:hypothetical protein